MQKKRGFAKKTLLGATKGLLVLKPVMVNTGGKISTLWGEEKYPAHLMTQE